jgi:hypothetical protein
MLFLFAFLPAILAQTPTVSLTNLTRGGSTLFWVDDTVLVIVTGPANQSVTVTDSINGVPHGIDFYFGQTNSSGIWTTEAVYEPEHTGHWSSAWKVGGVAATPTLDFWVFGEEEECIADVPNPAAFIYSTDYFNQYENIVSINPGGIEVVIESEAYNCVQVLQLTSTTTPLIVSYQNFESDFESDFTFVDDLGYVGYYPWIAQGAYAVIGVDITTGMPFYGQGFVTLTVSKEYIWQ